MPRTYIRKKPPPAYTTEDLAKAVRDILNSNKTYREASEHYGIPLGVMHNRIKGKTHVDKMGAGRSTDIPKEVEDTLAKCLIARAQMGFPCDKGELKTLVQQFVVANDINVRFKDGKPGEDWYYGFMKRHPNISLKKPEHLQKARKNARDPFVVYHFFEMVKDAYAKNSVDDDSGSFIFNADESGFPNDPSRLRGIGEKGKPLSRVSDGSGRDNTTVLACVSANGEVLPPLIVYKGQAVQQRWILPQPYPGTMYAATTNGWMEEVSFYEWFTKMFITHVNEIRKKKDMAHKTAFLFYDGHASHISIRIIEQAIINNVELIKFPSHLTDRLQPLDKYIFGPLKTEWDKVLVAHGKTKMGSGPSRLKKSEFATLLGNVWAKMKTDNIVKGFQSTGLFPLDETKLPEDLFDPRDLSQYKQRKAHLEHHTEPQAQNENRDKVAAEDLYFPGEIIPSADCEMFALDLSFKRSRVDASEGTSGCIPPNQVPTNLVDIFSRSIATSTVTSSSPVKKLPTTRLKQHTYGEVLSNDDVLQRLKDAEEKKKKPPKRQRGNKNIDKEVENPKKKVRQHEGNYLPDELLDDNCAIEDFRHEMEAEEVEEIIYLEPSVNDISQSTFVLVDIVGGTRNKTHFAYVCQVDEVLDEELAVTGMKSIGRNKIEFILVENDKYTITKSQVKAILPCPTYKKAGRKSVYKFSGSVNVKEK